MGPAGAQSGEDTGEPAGEGRVGVPREALAAPPPGACGCASSGAGDGPGLGAGCGGCRGAAYRARQPGPVPPGTRPGHRRAAAGCPARRGAGTGPERVGHGVLGGLGYLARLQRRPRRNRLPLHRTPRRGPGTAGAAAWLPGFRSRAVWSRGPRLRRPGFRSSCWVRAGAAVRLPGPRSRRGVPAPCVLAPLPGPARPSATAALPCPRFVVFRPGVRAWAGARAAPAGWLPGRPASAAPVRPGPRPASWCPCSVALRPAVLPRRARAGAAVRSCGCSRGAAVHSGGRRFL